MVATSVVRFGRISGKSPGSAYEDVGLVVAAFTPSSGRVPDAARWSVARAGPPRQQSGGELPRRGADDGRGDLLGVSARRTDKLVRTLQIRA